MCQVTPERIVASPGFSKALHFLHSRGKPQRLQPQTPAPAPAPSRSPNPTPTRPRTPTRSPSPNPSRSPSPRRSPILCPEQASSSALWWTRRTACPTGVTTSGPTTSSSPRCAHPSPTCLLAPGAAPARTPLPRRHTPAYHRLPFATRLSPHTCHHTPCAAPPSPHSLHHTPCTTLPSPHSLRYTPLQVPILALTATATPRVKLDCMSILGLQRAVVDCCASHRPLHHLACFHPPHPPHTPSHTLTHPHTPSHTLTHPHTPSHTLTHPHTPSHTLTHPPTSPHCRLQRAARDARVIARH